MTTRGTEMTQETPREAATPRPWFAQERDDDPSEPRESIVSIYGADGDSFAEVRWMPGTDNDPFADAALIVAAVNDYDRLRRVEAAARAFVEDHPHLLDPDMDGCATALALREALGETER